MSQNAVALPLTGVYSGTTAATDINGAIDTALTLNSGASAPGSPEEGWFWLDTSVSNQATLKQYDGSSWLIIGVLDQSTHRWSPPIGGGLNTIAGGGTTDLGSLFQAALTISGTATISSFGSTAPVGGVKILTFSGASVLTYNATSMILPTAANITTAAGDVAIAMHLGSGNWRILVYQLATGAALSSSANFLGAVNFAGTISPTSLSANTNNWAPTGFSTSEYIRIAVSPSPINITGLAGGSAGLQKTLVNISSFNVTLTANDASSTSGNLFLMPFPLVLTPGASQQLRYDGVSNGWRPVSPVAARTISGAFKNLKIVNDSGAPTTTMDITADALTLEDAFGNAYRALSVSVAPVMTTSGVNGLDTGTIVNNIITWYAEYVIYNPTTNTVAGLYSLSASAAALLASGNMPSGYTFAMRVGWVRTDGAATARWMRQTQVGRNARWTITAATNTTAPPVITSGLSGSLATPTWTSVSISNFVPPSASSIDLSLVIPEFSNSSNKSMAVAPNANYGAYTSAAMSPFTFVTGSSGVGISAGGAMPARVQLESTNISYAGGDTTCSVNSVGWEDNL